MLRSPIGKDQASMRRGRGRQQGDRLALEPLHINLEDH
jgi:hypothetical protein